MLTASVVEGHNLPATARPVITRSIQDQEKHFARLAARLPALSRTFTLRLSIMSGGRLLQDSVSWPLSRELGTEGGSMSPDSYAMFLCKQLLIDPVEWVGVIAHWTRVAVFRILERCTTQPSDGNRWSKKLAPYSWGCPLAAVPVENSTLPRLLLLEPIEQLEMLSASLHSIGRLELLGGIPKRWKVKKRPRPPPNDEEVGVEDEEHPDVAETD